MSTPPTLRPKRHFDALPERGVGSEEEDLETIRRLKKALDELGRSDIVIVVGGVIQPQDYDALYEAGAAHIFGPGTVIAEAAIELLEDLKRRLS